MDPIEVAYIESLNDKERKAYAIAESHLGSSFDLSKSSGFIKWKRTYVLPTITEEHVVKANDLKSR
jgi:hypothetical protein